MRRVALAVELVKFYSHPGAIIVAVGADPSNDAGDVDCVVVVLRSKRQSDYISYLIGIKVVRPVL